MPRRFLVLSNPRSFLPDGLSALTTNERMCGPPCQGPLHNSAAAPLKLSQGFGAQGRFLKREICCWGGKVEAAGGEGEGGWVAEDKRRACKRGPVSRLREGWGFTSSVMAHRQPLSLKWSSRANRGGQKFCHTQSFFF